MGRPAQVEEEGLIRFADRVAVDRHADRLGGLPGGEGRHATGRYVIAAGQRRAVGRGIGDRDRLAAGRRQGDGEVQGGGAAVALAHGHVANTQAGHGVVVDDGPGALGIGNDDVGRRAQVEEEGLIGFVDRVAVNRHGDRLDGLPGGESRDAAGGHVIAARQRRAVGRGPGNGYGRGARRRKGQGERHGGRTCIPFARVHVRDRDAGQGVVVLNHALRLSARQAGIGGVAQADGERLQGFEEGVVEQPHVQVGHGVAGGHSKGAVGGQVVTAGLGRAVGRGPRHGDRHVGRVRQGHREGDPARAAVPF